MRCIRLFFTILLLFSLTNEKVGAQALDTGFSTEALSQDDIDTVLKNVNISMLAGEPSKRPIECFDVGENGVIAIGCSDSENKTVCIYTDDGDFQYGYSFECSGDFGVELHENILNIYVVRGNVLLSVDAAGKIVSVLKIQNTSENNSYWNHFVFLTKREVGGNTYTIKNDMGIFNVFASSYSQLTVTDVDGGEKIIYDVSQIQFLNTLAVFICAIAFIGLAVTIIIRKSRICV